MSPPSPAPAAARAAAALPEIRDNFRGYWSTYVGNTRIALLRAACGDVPSA